MARLFGIILILIPQILWAVEPSLHHQMFIEVNPEQHFIKVDDRITFNNISLESNSTLSIALHKNLQLQIKTPGVSIKLVTSHNYTVPVNLYELHLDRPIKQLQLSYSGPIYHQLTDKTAERVSGMRNSAGIISAEGVYLSASSYWYPAFDSLFNKLGRPFERLSFELNIDLPQGWHSVSQGDFSHLPKNDIEKWQSKIPQNEIYLIAAPFKRYEQQYSSGITGIAYLRQSDEALAQRYLKVTEQYLDMYSQMLGPYPFTKFALVENFWESGFGMPSFTLLGSRVIRLPFILYTSYPHEIVHNWWGNGVYVDYRKGNWSEGLTAYLADHLLKEQRGKGSDYRQQLLQKYTDYVAHGGDFALADFRGRHSSITEAVGYGKTLMLFHMLRLKLGDKVFIQGLRELFQNFQFRLASYDNVQESFEKVSGQNLDMFFKQWVERVGAPKLAIDKMDVSQNKQGYQLNLGLIQNQQYAYHLDIPVAVTLKGQSHAEQINLSMQQLKQEFQLQFSAQPLRIDIDPQFDLFRNLSRDEIPTVLTQLFAAKKIRIALPSQQKDKIEAYKSFAKQLFKPDQELQFIMDNQKLLETTSDTPLVLLGWDNLLISDYPEIKKHKLDKSKAQLLKQEINRDNHSLVITHSNSKNSEQTITWISSDSLPSLSGLARKLPHYHKYSYLSFSGEQPTIKLKGRWPVNQSSMTVKLEDIERGKLKSLTPLDRISDNAKWTGKIDN